MRGPEAPLSASEPPPRARHEEPPEQQPADAQTDQVQEDQFAVAGDEGGAATTSATSPVTTTFLRLHQGRLSGISSTASTTGSKAVQIGIPTSASRWVMTTPGEQPPV